MKRLFIEILPKFTFVVIFINTILFFSCNASKTNLENPIKTYIPQYANGFKIYYYDDFKILEVAGVYKYCLKSAENERKIDIAQKNTPIIETPISRTACMAHSHWAAADLFNKTESIFGICDSEYINDSVIISRIKNKTLQNIATNQTIFLEQLLMLQPQILMVSFFDSPLYPKIESQNIVVVRNGDYLENHPLGRAEWMIFTAAFFNEEQKAIVMFDEICKKYNNLKEIASKEIASKAEARPTVFDGSEYNGIWYVSGGKSFMAKFYEDAGADYVWKDDENTSSVPLNIETVYKNGINADYWRMYLHNNETYQNLKEKNRHYSDFKSWKEQKIIYCNNLKSDLFGTGVFKPDVVLADFVSAFHPSLLPDYTPFYYKPLQNQ